MKKILFFSLILIASCKPVKTTNSGETMLVSYKINQTKKTDKPFKYDPTELEFELLYDNEKSLFQLVDKLDENSNSFDAKITKGIYDGHLKFYKNKTENIKL